MADFSIRDMPKVFSYDKGNVGTDKPGREGGIPLTRDAQGRLGVGVSTASIEEPKRYG